MINRNKVLELLKENNPKASDDKIVMYTDLYMDYQEASLNIRTHGALVSHPKTGAPIDNPYLKIRTKMNELLRKIRVNSSGLWELE